MKKFKKQCFFSLNSVDFIKRVVRRVFSILEPPVDEHSDGSQGPPPQYEPGKFKPNGQVTLISTSNEVAAEIIQQQTGNEVLTVSELRKSPVKPEVCENPEKHFFIIFLHFFWYKFP